MLLDIFEMVFRWINRNFDIVSFNFAKSARLDNISFIARIVRKNFVVAVLSSFTKRGKEKITKKLATLRKKGIKKYTAHLCIFRKRV
jgi:hypothetical protein